MWPTLFHTNGPNMWCTSQGLMWLHYGPIFIIMYTYPPLFFIPPRNMDINDELHRLNPTSVYIDLHLCNWKKHFLNVVFPHQLQSLKCIFQNHFIQLHKILTTITGISFPCDILGAPSDTHPRIMEVKNIDLYQALSPLQFLKLLGYMTLS